MRGLEGRGKYSERGRRKTQRETEVKGNNKTRKGGTRTSNEVKQQTSVTCVK